MQGLIIRGVSIGLVPIDGCSDALGSYYVVFAPFLGSYLQRSERLPLSCFSPDPVVNRLGPHRCSSGARVFFCVEHFNPFVYWWDCHYLLVETASFSLEILLQALKVNSFRTVE